MVRSGCGCGRDEGPRSGPEFGRQPGPEPGPEPALGAAAGERGDRADARSPALFQVLLHVLFEHAVGYALLALKEVEEISLLLPQVGEGGGGLPGRVAAPWAPGPRHAPRAPTWPAALWGGCSGPESSRAGVHTRVRD